jgi:hypothetical protein
MTIIDSHVTGVFSTIKRVIHPATGTSRGRAKLQTVGAGSLNKRLS